MIFIVIIISFVIYDIIDLFLEYRLKVKTIEKAKSLEEINQWDHTGIQ